MNVFFTADTHFGHGRIIQYTQRPFMTSEEMDETIIQRFNEVLRKGDVLYHLGDVSWSTFDKRKGFLERLNTKEIHLIWGNHDKPQDFKGLPFRSFAEFKKIKAASQRFFLCHYPMRSWQGKGGGTIQLYGHCHGTMPGIGRQMDVGVDTHNFYPWHVDEIVDKMRDVPIFEEGGLD